MLTTAITCLALTIFHEARGELIPGQYAVAQVTWRRAGMNEKAVCATVLAPHQFSWTKTLTRRVKGGYRLKSAGIPQDARAWSLALRIAQAVMSHRMPDITGGALFYHERSVRPWWAKRYRLVRVIGNHRFYAQT